MSYVTVHTADTEPSAMQLRQEYYALRRKAFNDYWGMNLYTDGPDELDLKPETAYVLRVEEGHVVAGARLLFHRPGSTEQVRAELSHPAFAMSNLLPHLDTKALSYCELGGVVADADKARELKHLGTDIVRETLASIQSGAIRNGGTNIAAILYSASKSGLSPLLHAANAIGMHGIVRTDLIQQEEDARFDTKLWPILLAPDPAFPFMTQALRDSGAVGFPLSEYRTPPSPPRKTR